MNPTDQEPSPTIHTVSVGDDLGGDRLDVVVAALVPGVSRSAAQRLIKAGHVLVGDRRRPQGYRVPTGTELTVTIPPRASGPAAGPMQGSLDILYEDEALVVINKRAGLVVHPGAGHRSGTLADLLLASGRALSVVGGTDRAGLVHRLDRDTSGVLMAAKDDRSHEALASQFKNRTINKAYLALVLGKSVPDRELISTLFGRRHGDRKQFTGRVSTGREAVTGYEALLRAELCSLLLVRPKTGRTHQIRVHLAERGFPVVGDRVYGRGYPRKGSLPTDEVTVLNGLKRLALHAYALRFTHPGTGSPQTVLAPIPRDLRVTLEGVFGPDWIVDLPKDPFGVHSPR